MIRVLLIEAGGEGRSIYVDIPSGFWVIRNNPKFDWCFLAEPDPGINSRRMVTPRGKALGGSSTINGQMYMRGHPLDYDNWAAMGAKGWSFAEVLPYFRKSETFGGGGDEYRGDRGPLITTPAPLANPLYRVFLEAAEQAGYARTADINGYRQDGFGVDNMTVSGAVRWGTSRAYLRPARKALQSRGGHRRAGRPDRGRGQSCGRRRLHPGRTEHFRPRRIARSSSARGRSARPTC